MADKEDPRQSSRTDAVRGAAVQAFQATAGQAGVTRERAQELADELASAAGKLIGAFDELRPATADEVRALRTEVRELKERVDALETRMKGSSAVRKPAATKKPAASKPKTSATRSAAAKKPAPGSSS